MYSTYVRAPLCCQWSLQSVLLPSHVDLPPEIPDEQMRETASSSEASVFSPVTTPSGPVSLYRALYSYNPMEQSPNPNPETELELELGQMVIVYGDVREVSGDRV